MHKIGIFFHYFGKSRKITIQDGLPADAKSAGGVDHAGGLERGCPGYFMTFG
jgi:hypothetical protein